MRFVLPVPPNRANARGGWRKHHRAKLDYWERLDTIQLLKAHEGFEAAVPPERPFAQARIAATLYTWNLSDEDALMVRCKWILDWLVTRGYVVNDDRRRLRWTAIPEQVIDRKNPRVEITLVEVPLP